MQNATVLTKLTTDYDESGRPNTTSTLMGEETEQIALYEQQEGQYLNKIQCW
jgi:hypothetical protein